MKGYKKKSQCGQKLKNKLLKKREAGVDMMATSMITTEKLIVIGVAFSSSLQYFAKCISVIDMSI